MIQQTEEIIKRFKLRRKCRNRYLIHQRSFLMLRLQKHGLSVSRIAQIFDLTHATIIHNVRKAEYYEQIEDRLYLSDTAEIRKEIESNPVVRNTNDLISEILECNTIRRLEKIQRRILRNEYELK